MAYQIIRRPDGLWALWSTVVDDFVHDGVSEEDVIEHFVDEATETVRDNAQRIIKGIKGGDERVYFDRTMTYEGACSWRDYVHREEDG